MGAIIPLLLALLVLQFGHGRAASIALEPWLAAVATVLAWLVLAEAGTRLSARQGARAFAAWEHAAQGCILGLFAWLCFGAGWTAWAPGWTAALAPWLVMQAGLWSAQAPVLRARGATWTRGGLVLHHLRFELAPALVVLPLIDLGEWLGARLGILHWFGLGGEGLLLSLVAGWLLVLALLAVLPAALAVLWGARPLPDDELARSLAADCRRAGVPDARLRLWRSPGGSVHNALAIGLLPGMRWVMLSEDLLRDLPPEQVRAVVAHELGHHRHRHLLIYLWFAFACLLAKWGAFVLLVEGASWSEPGLVWSLPGVAALPFEAVAGAVVVGCVLVCWRLLFGVVSRGVEREADLAGADLAGHAAMAGALRTVARLSGTPEDAPSWRHHPIRERVRFLEAAAADPALASLHRRSARSMRLAIIVSLALVAALAASLWFDPLREASTTNDPAGMLLKRAAAAPALDTALRAADGGDTGPFIAWLGRAEPSERQIVALLTLRSVELSGGSGPDGRPLPPDDRAPWRLRHRLAALSAVPLEDRAGLGLAIDNMFAYALVAGTRQVPERDLAMARSVLPRLVAAVSTKPEHAILDTIACIHFVGNDWDGARRALEQALANLAEAKDPLNQRPVHEALYRSRLDAAIHNQAVTAGSRPGPLRPLPLTFASE